MKKKNNSICYHAIREDAIREAVAVEEVITAYVSTNEDMADLGTKVGAKRDMLVGMLMYDIIDTANLIVSIKRRQ